MRTTARAMDTHYRVDVRNIAVGLSHRLLDLAQHVCRLAGQPVRKPKQRRPLIVVLSYAISQLSKSFKVSTSGANVADMVHLLACRVHFVARYTVNISDSSMLSCARCSLWT